MTPTNTIKIEEAVLDTTVATFFSAAASVGMGLRVGGVGGGPESEIRKIMVYI